MKVWITKYALTQGILEVEGIVCGPKSQMVKIFRDGRHMELFHTEWKEWHRTEEGAKLKAEEMAVKKIESLNKQILKIQKLTF